MRPYLLHFWQQGKRTFSGLSCCFWNGTCWSKTSKSRFGFGSDIRITGACLYSPHCYICIVSMCIYSVYSCLFLWIYRNQLMGCTLDATVKCYKMDRRKSGKKPERKKRGKYGLNKRMKLMCFFPMLLLLCQQ